MQVNRKPIRVKPHGNRKTTVSSRTSPLYTRRRPSTDKAPMMQLKELRSRPFLRGVGNIGVLSAPEPYAGPREFAVSGDLVIKFRGKVHAVFWIRRDESLFLPYGGFRVYYKNREIGRSLSWPTFDDCRRIRRTAGKGRIGTGDFHGGNHDEE